MPIETHTLPRTFRYNSVLLEDPGPQFDAAAVRDLYSATYPEIVNAAIEGPEEKDGKLEYTFRRAVGTKGATAAVVDNERAQRIEAVFKNAVTGTARPDEKTPLHRAPYFNVWASGQICSGNVRLPERLSPAAIAGYERAFFDSEFTHPNVSGKEKLVNAPKGPYGFWKGWMEFSESYEPQLPFPSQVLVPLNLTLAGLAKRLEKESDK